MTVANPRQGLCYELAGKRILNDQGWMLVHGIARGVLHAWCERDGVVWEPVYDFEHAVGDFYKKFTATAYEKYAEVEAARHMVKAGHWGPWNAEELK